MSRTEVVPPLDVRVISVLKSSGSGPTRTELRLVSWNGKEPVLEKRQFIRDRTTGEERAGKCRGLTRKDVDFIASNYPDISRAMDGAIS
jgi:hypothetical protein